MEKLEGNLEVLHKSTWPHSSSSLANIRVIFWQKTTKIWSRGKCIQNFRSLLFYITSGQGVRYKFKHEQGNQGDMGKIHVTQQFFAASGPQDHFFWKKNQEPVFTYVLGKCVVFRLVRKSRTDRHTNPHIYEQHTHLHTWIFDIWIYK